MSIRLSGTALLLLIAAYPAFAINAFLRVVRYMLRDRVLRYPVSAPAPVAVFAAPAPSSVASAVNQKPRCVVCLDYKWCTSLIPCKANNVCYGCLESSVMHQTKERPRRNDIVCPSGCNKPLPLKLVRHFNDDWAPGNIFIKCPKCTASHKYLSVYGNVRNCDSCRLRWCGVCDGPYECTDHDCGSMEQNKLREMLRAGQVQLCYACPVLFQKNEGCPRVCC